MKEPKNVTTKILNVARPNTKVERTISVKPSVVIGACLLAMIIWSIRIGSEYQYYLLSAALVIGATLPGMAQNEESNS